MKKRWFLIPLSLLAVPVFAFQARLFPVLGARPTVAEQERYAASQAYNPDAEVFQNRRPELFARMRENMEFLPMARKWFSARVDGRPASPLPEQQPNLQAFLAPGSDLKVIWFGHSTFLLNVAGTIVLVDPVFSETAAPVGFTARRFQPSVLSLEKLPPIDIILISHDHYDHLDTETMKPCGHRGCWQHPIRVCTSVVTRAMTPMLGEVITINESLETSPWWESVVHADS